MVIRDRLITKKGSCFDHQRDYYLVRNRQVLSALSLTHSLSVCVRVNLCACARARACVRACVCVVVRGFVRRVLFRVLSHRAYKGQSCPCLSRESLPAVPHLCVCVSVSVSLVFLCFFLCLYLNWFVYSRIGN